MPFNPDQFFRPVASSELEPNQPVKPGGFLNWISNLATDWNERLGNAYEQMNSANSAVAQAGLDMAANGTDYGKGVIDVINGVQGNAPSDMVHIDPDTLAPINGNNIGSSGGSNSAKAAGQISLDSIFGSSAKNIDPALQSYYNMYLASGNEAYLEKMLDYNASLSSTASAREWEKMMSDTSFSRMMSDIESAGYNPWLALQNGASSGASAYSTNSAGSPGGSATSQETSRANTQASNTTDIITSLIRTVATLALFGFAKGKTGGIGTKVTNIYN